MLNNALYIFYTSSRHVKDPYAAAAAALLGTTCGLAEGTAGDGNLRGNRRSPDSPGSLPRALEVAKRPQTWI